jgi:hypothetical protein
MPSWSRTRFEIGLCLGIILVLLWQYRPLRAPPLPPSESAFIAAVSDSTTAWAAAPNDVARLPLRAARAAAICNALPNLTATGWAATVVSVTPNTLPDLAGKPTARITLQLAPHIQLSTPANPLFNNPANMVQAGTPLYTTAATLHPGQTVTFSARFFADSTDCVFEDSFTADGSMRSPEFKIQLLQIK